MGTETSKTLRHLRSPLRGRAGMGEGKGILFYSFSMA